MSLESEVRFVEFTVNHLWKYLRIPLRSHLSPRCKKCILTSQVSPLDADGVCALCKSGTQGVGFERSAEEKTQDLRRFQEIVSGEIARRKPQSAYDGLLLLSGGKDSVYMLHRLQQEFPNIRLLTLLVDNGFMSPVALQNAQDVLKKFEVPHLHLHLHPQFVKSVFHFALTHLNLQKGYSFVDLMDGTMTVAQGWLLAAQLNIPMLFLGLGTVQIEGIFGPTFVEMGPDREGEGVRKLCGLTPEEVSGPQWKQFWYRPEDWSHVPRMILPMTAWDPSETEVLQYVTDKGLINPNRHRPLLTNNALVPVIGLAEMAQFGFCTWEVEFAKMIRAGKSERAYWLHLFEMLEYSARTGKFVNKGVAETLARLGLTKKDIGLI